MIPQLSEKELKVLLYIEHKKGGLTPPEGMSVAGYATACDGLKARGFANPGYIEGHEVETVHILPAGLSFLEDWREDEKKKNDELEQLRNENSKLKERLEKFEDDSRAMATHQDIDEIFPEEAKGNPVFEYDENSETMFLYGHSTTANNSTRKITNKKRGRPKALNFEEYIMPTAPRGLMSVLEQMLEGKNGKEAFSIILAITNVYIKDPSMASVCEKFKSVTRSSYESARSRHYGINRFQNNPTPIEETELERIREEIKSKLLLRSENT